MQTEMFLNLLKEDILNNQDNDGLLVLSIAYLVANEAKNIRKFETEEVAFQTILGVVPNIDENIKNKVATQLYSTYQMCVPMVVKRSRVRENMLKKKLKPKKDRPISKVIIDNSEIMKEIEKALRIISKMGI